MATKVKLSASLKPAVGYLRMSSDQQDMSIDQQHDEIVRFAAREGYVIVRWYIDRGKSGSLRIQDRKEFLRMIQDSHRKDFVAVLCWDVKRFGRLHPLKAAQYKDTLRSNGVYLHTVCEGVIKWDQFSELVVDAVHQAAAYEYSKALSKDSIRGRLHLLESGEWPNGKVPYGYDKVYVEPDGTEHHVPRLKTFPGKGKGWRRLLVTNDHEARIVAWLFREFLDNDLSMRELARRVSVTRPDGSAKPWTKDTIKEILLSKAYAGYAFIGGGRGKGGLRAKEVHNRAGYHEKAGCIPAIVSLEDWQRAVDKINRNKDENRKVRPAEASYLSGVLVCGHCGYRMEKHARTDRDGTRYAYFSCSSAIKRPALGCKQWRVREADILPMVIERLVKEVDRTILEASKVQGPNEPGDAAEALRAQLAEVVKRVTNGRRNVLGAEAHRKAEFDAILAEWEREQAELERQIANLTITEGDVSRFAKWWESVRGSLVEVLPGRVEADGVTASIALEQGEWTATVEADGKTSKRKARTANHARVEAMRISPEKLPHIPSPVLVEGERFRGLLKSIGFVVKLWWKPMTCTYQKGPKKGQTYQSDRFYELDHAVIDAGGEHAVAEHNNRYSRVRIRGTG